MTISVKYYHMEHLYFCLAQERAVSLLELRHHCYPKSATHFQIVWKLYTVEILIIMDFNICINMIVRREIIICLSLSIKKKKKTFISRKMSKTCQHFSIWATSTQPTNVKLVGQHSLLQINYWYCFLGTLLQFYTPWIRCVKRHFLSKDIQLHNSEAHV